MEIFDCRFLIVDFRSEAPHSESRWRSLRSSIHNQQFTHCGFDSFSGGGSFSSFLSPG